MPQGNILLLSDGSHLFPILSRLLTAAGHQVTTTYQTQEAIQLLRSQNFPLIITCLSNDWTDTRPFIKAVRELKAETAVMGDFLRRGLSCGYYAESEREVDFVSGPRDAPRVVEVKYESTFDWEDRRYEGVRHFLRRFPACPEVTIVTREATGQVTVGDTEVTAMPLWRYLLRE